ncbi:MAG: TonB-dependent receptor, partial [Halanaerobiales bacterium]|nr:TonB-dependent receptor [Halanaerobiales bacterium]
MKQGTFFEGDEVGGNKQYNLRSNLDFSFIDNLDISLDVSLRQQDVTNSNVRYAAVFQTSALTSPLLPKFINDDPRYPAAGRASQNPIAMFRAKGYNENDRMNQTIIGNFTYRIPGLEGLSIGGFASGAFANDDYKNFDIPWTYYVPNMDDPSGTPVAQQAGQLKLEQGHDKSRLVTGNLNVKYVKTINEHSIDGLFQVEKQTYRRDYYNAGNDDFLSSASDYFDSASTSRDASWVSGAAEETARISYSGRLNYNYKGKYMLQALFRYDGSEKFAEGKRFGFFPGVSGAWLISEEDFLKENSTLSLKVKASWGQLGNDRIPAYNYLSRYVFGNSTVVNGKTITGVRESGSSNPDVTWEVTESLNLGVEASFNKLWLEVNLFDMQTKDILATPQLTLPQYTGIQPPNQNIGQHQNRGFELETMYRDKICDFNFAIGGNVSYT